MNDVLRLVTIRLLNSHIIGEKHTPESAFITSKLKYLSKVEQNDFKKEYGRFIQDGYIIRQRKKTGKGSDWHICLNPEQLGELRILIEGEAK
jgi:hypothetical protein